MVPTSSQTFKTMPVTSFEIESSESANPSGHSTSFGCRCCLQRGPNGACACCPCCYRRACFLGSAGSGCAGFCIAFILIIVALSVGRDASVVIMFVCLLLLCPISIIVGVSGCCCIFWCKGAPEDLLETGQRQHRADVVVATVEYAAAQLVDENLPLSKREVYGDVHRTQPISSYAVAPDTLVQGTLVPDSLERRSPAFDVDGLLAHVRAGGHDKGRSVSAWFARSPPGVLPTPEDLVAIFGAFSLSFELVDVADGLTAAIGPELTVYHVAAAANAVSDTARAVVCVKLATSLSQVNKRRLLPMIEISGRPNERELGL